MQCNPSYDTGMVGAYRTTTPSTITMVQGVACQVGVITIEVVVGMTQSTDSSTVPQVALNDRRLLILSEIETIVVRLWLILLQPTYSVS